VRKRGETAPTRDLRHRFREVAQHLLTLEINTIVKDNMTARKMPPIPIALLEIAAEYYWFIDDLNRFWQVPEVAEHLVGLEPENRRNHPETFDALREASTQLMDVMRAAPKAAPETDDRRACEYVTLERIYRTASLLPRMLKQLEAANPNASLWNARRQELLEIYESAATIHITIQQLSFIRKAWEIGVETIALQSTLQLDGDIVTCIQKGYANATHKALHDMHLGVTRLSIDTWETIVRLVIDLLSGVTESFSRLLTGR
jgi:hypothetical protein